MNAMLYTFNDFLCGLNEILWPAATFLICMVSGICMVKKKGIGLERTLALSVFSVFVIYVAYCYFYRKPIGISIPMSIGLICSIMFYFDWKKPKKDIKSNTENELQEIDSEREITPPTVRTDELPISEQPTELPQRQKPGKSIDTRTIFDFIIGKNISDKTAYIQQLKDLMEGRRGQKALEECILPELGTNISTDITFRAFDETFPNVIDKAGFSRFKKKIPSKITLQKL